jgi:hypothetical protein
MRRKLACYERIGVDYLNFTAINASSLLQVQQIRWDLLKFSLKYEIRYRTNQLAKLNFVRMESEHSTTQLFPARHRLYSSNAQYLRSSVQRCNNFKPTGATVLSQETGNDFLVLTSTNPSVFSSTRDNESDLERNAIIAPLHATPEHSQLLTPEPVH